MHLHNFLLSPHLVSDWSTLSAHSNEVELVHDIIDSSDDEHYDDEDDSNGLLTLFYYITCYHLFIVLSVVLLYYTTFPIFADGTN